MITLGPQPPSATTASKRGHEDYPFLSSASTVRLLNHTPLPPSSVHAIILKFGLQGNLLVNNALLSAYFRQGDPLNARKLFDEMLDRDVVTWTTFMSGNCQNDASSAALLAFSDMLRLQEVDAAPRPNEFTLAAALKACAKERDNEFVRAVHGYVIVSGFVSDPFVQISLVDTYSKCGPFASAERLVTRTPCISDVVAWTSLVSGCVESGLDERALAVFLRMVECGQRPNAVTMLSTIRACSSISERGLLGWVHAWVVKLGLCDDVFVANSLVEMYSKNASIGDAVELFHHHYCFVDANTPRETGVMAALIHGCSTSCSLRLGEAIHGYLIKNAFLPCTLLENSLMDFYGKKGKIPSMRQLFMSLATPDIVSWNTMISCFVRHNHGMQALQLLSKLHCETYNLKPDFVTLLNCTQACSDTASLERGQILHAYCVKAGLEHDVFIGNALIDMYAKTGSIDSSHRRFKEMPVKDLGSWNSMIAAYGMHGDGKSALTVFRELQRCGNHCPNAITFLSLISACGHAGLSSAGCDCFNSMIKDYEIIPWKEHYSCMVDLLCRSGRLQEAVNFIKQMPTVPGSSIWLSLLGASSIHGNLETAEFAAERLFVLEPACNAWRVLLSNTYSLAGKWDLAANLRAGMRGGESSKEAGWSCIDLRGGETYKFMVADTRHLQSKVIYQVLDGIMEQIVDVEDSP